MTKATIKRKIANIADVNPYLLPKKQRRQVILLIS